jgi:hypothetical protein
MKRLLFVVALVLVTSVVSSSHVGAASQCCVTACGTSHAHGTGTSTQSCAAAESKALSNAAASTGCTNCWNSSPVLRCTKSGSTWTGTADFDYICYTPCGVC